MSMSVSSVEKYLRRGVIETQAFVREREGLEPRQEATKTAGRGRDVSIR